VTSRCENNFIEKFNAHYGEAFIYVGGYSTERNNRITIECKRCGYIRERKRRGIFFDRNISCPVCGNNRKSSGVSAECSACGSAFIKYNPQHTLCVVCHRNKERAQRNQHKRLREARATKNGRVDYSITLSGLIGRDRGVCQLCGRPVDESDYVYIGDTFVAGNSYPSIDHITPLSKGGLHQWSNVQLAHRMCNSIKCDK
jgi:5-methylcytosine-specific restriction endonuclease McrA